MKKELDLSKLALAPEAKVFPETRVPVDLSPDQEEALRGKRYGRFILTVSEPAPKKLPSWEENARRDHYRKNRSN